MSKPIVLAIALGILLLFGWAIKHFYFSEAPSTESLTTEPVIVTPPSPAINDIKSEQKLKPAEPSSKEDGGELGSQRIVVDKAVRADDKPADLPDHTMSIKRVEKKGVEIMPGVNVKSGVVHIQLDQDNSRSIEVERNPSNSNSEYQLILKKKF